MINKEIAVALAGSLWSVKVERLKALQLLAASGKVDGTPESEREATRKRVADALDAASTRAATKGTRSVGVVRMSGVVSHRSGLFADLFGTSVESFTYAFRQMARSPHVGAIVIDMDTPGGNVAGIPELADEIYATRAEKPVYAIANANMHSAGLWIGSASTKVFAIPSAEVGSHGVVYTHVNQAKALEDDGIAVEFVHAGPYKVEGNSTSSLTDEARSHIQSQVDAFYDMFTASLAKGRGMSTKAVVDKFGGGRSYIAAEAKERGMVDDVATFDEVVALAQRKVAAIDRNSKRRAEIASV